LFRAFICAVKGKNMGMQSAQVQSGTQPQGKGPQQPLSSQQFQNREGSSTNAATSGQPTFGQPNRYPNTVSQWDNASIQRQPSGGKGSGQSPNQQPTTQPLTSSDLVKVISSRGGKGKG
jgi:hypothetical protein